MPCMKLSDQKTPTPVTIIKFLVCLLFLIMPTIPKIIFLFYQQVELKYAIGIHKV